jgi:hypothetical protein
MISIRAAAESDIETLYSLDLIAHSKNERRQSLLAKCGYDLSGVIHNLDDGDPEIVYFKRLG